VESGGSGWFLSLVRHAFVCSDCTPVVRHLSWRKVWALDSWQGRRGCQVELRRTMSGGNNVFRNLLEISDKSLIFKSLRE
jgi:hypothetical protein